MELKPCPFCGGKARLATECRGIAHGAFIKCDSCGTKSEWFSASIYYTAVEKAAEAWNRRTDND